MLCELYNPSIAMPEAPKPNFFAKLFVSNPVVDSDELCKIFLENFNKKKMFVVFFSVGEAAGKAPLGIARKEDVNININQMRGKADSATSVVNDTRMVKVLLNK